MQSKIVRSVFVAAAMIAVTASANLRAEGDPKTGRVKAEGCLGCHGIEGYRNAYPSYRVPKVGGQSETYIIAALKAYRSGQRSHPTMRAQGADLSDEDIADIAAYFANTEGSQ